MDPEKLTASITSSNDETTNLTARVLDVNAERALARRFDYRLLPVLAIMFMFNALDKGNLGNAKTNTLEKDLHFTGNQYNITLAVFFVPYVLFAPPLGILGKKYGPSRVLPIIMFGFGSMTLLGACVKDFGGMLTVRCILGATESAVFPLVIYYLTTFYRRGELARRLALFFAGGNLANGFSGLLAFGVFQISHPTIPSWRILFLLEGSCTILFSLFAYWYLPHSAATASFLSPAEKELAFHRIQVDSSSVVDEKFNLREALKVFRMPVAWVWLGIEMCVGVPLQSVALFLPQIVGRLGHSSVKTNLFTFAPNVTGAVMLLILAFISDYKRLRFPFIAVGFSLTLIGFVVYASVDTVSDEHIAYFATFMMCWGISAPSVLLSTWYNNNIAHEGRRVALTSVGVPLANLMGIVSSNIFRPQDAPDYIPALITTACFGAIGVVLAVSLGTYMVYDNRRRDREQGVCVDARDIPTKILAGGPDVKEFRWFL